MRPELYIKTMTEVYALQFDYSDKGLKALTEFLGTCLLHVKKHRHPSSAATAVFKNNNQSSGESIIQQGDYIIRDDNGFWPVTQTLFETTYIKV